ncbi:hypothetical protein IG631_07754 [Alternaria alternata]|nr:hypothetical protein IG631_07754 [Alternaria alternata]
MACISMRITSSTLVALRLELRSCGNDAFRGETRRQCSVELYLSTTWHATCLSSFAYCLLLKDQHYLYRRQPTGQHGSMLACGSLHEQDIMVCFVQADTYDHRTLKIRLPVRSAIYKQCTGGLVVRWVTTSESPLLYVFAFCFTSLSNRVIHTRRVPPSNRRTHARSKFIAPLISSMSNLTDLIEIAFSGE